VDSYARSFLSDYGSEKFWKKLIGRTDVEDAVLRLDSLTNEESLMAVATILGVAGRVDDSVQQIKAIAESTDGNVGQIRILAESTGGNVEQIKALAESTDGRVHEIDQTMKAVEEST
jgi:methyl-accepting chemotaxis protein